MKKILLILLLGSLWLEAEEFSQQDMAGTWQISSYKQNGFVTFGKDIGKQRREKWNLLFNHEGKLKVQETGSLYQYEITNGMLKIYEVKVHKNGYEIRQDRWGRYDLMKIDGKVDGCLHVKWKKKGIQGLKKKKGFKMCKIEGFPQATYQRSASDYKFK